MPSIDELKIKKPSKKFQKVNYRPWETENPHINHSGEEKDHTLIETEKQNINVIDAEKTQTEQNFYETKNKIEINISKNAIYQNPDLETRIKCLFGVQRNIMLFLSTKVGHEDDSYCYTVGVSAYEIVTYTRSSSKSISASLIRLKHKGFLSTLDYKPGRGGFARYKIEKSVCKYLMQLQR